MHNNLIHVDTSKTETDIAGNPTVGILMSTYNGACHLKEQIESIAAQKDVSIILKIRDDGSEDETISLANTLKSEYSSEHFSIEIENGINLGFLNSFEKLLLGAEGCDFYAFSDQDDVWDSNKLASAISSISAVNDAPAMYASSVTTTNEELEYLSCNHFPKFEYSIPSEFVRHRLAGHTMVWNENLQAFIRAFGPMPVWSHDQHIVLSALLTQAPLFLDNSSHVKHRRLNSSITPGGGSVRKRIAHECSLIFNKGNRIDRKALADALLGNPKYDLSAEDQIFLQNVADGNHLSLLKSRHLHCGLHIGDLEAKLSIILGKF